METLSRAACHGGVQSFHSHQSNSTGTAMRFGVFVPPGNGPFPVLWCLAGLTCTEETFAIKAGAQRLAAELGLMLVTPDTSPRGEGVADDTAWDMGQAASFYLDATAEPWAAHFRMRTWLIDELPRLIAAHFSADMARQGITGHSMGGHGALTLALKHPGLFRSVSALAPIVAPTQVPWGRKALPAYLGDDPAAHAAHDACALIDGGARVEELLVDQGEADAFLAEQLQPERLEVACARASIPLTLRRHAGYDHGYWFVQSFVADHLRWHAARLTA
ncbi:S-formylglutathione hydrolase [Sandarakinorhabdus limnophila]|uniref:S-formylglutathione hydrolase n=1 Tax=Sandarakinorhabdus limnophila TaxID=210512 RepID=UPI0003B645EC|nr:S-formylglutathione hydrolase [Sandarakinorhabdus limnophila]